MSKIALERSRGPQICDQSSILWYFESKLKIKKNDLEGSLGVFKNQKSFFNLDNLNTLIKFWIKETKRKDEIIQSQIFKKDSLYKLLILENFHNSKKLIKIADFIYDKTDLNSHEYLLLAGFYYRLNNVEKFKKIINIIYALCTGGKI